MVEAAAALGGSASLGQSLFLDRTSRARARRRACRVVRVLGMLLCASWCDLERFPSGVCGPPYGASRARRKRAAFTALAQRKNANTLLGALQRGAGRLSGARTHARRIPVRTECSRRYGGFDVLWER